jgi:hypothetical protein
MTTVAEVEVLYNALRATPEYARWIAADREIAYLLALRNELKKKCKRADDVYVQERAVARYQAKIDALREEWLTAEIDYAAERTRIMRELGQC